MRGPFLFPLEDTVPEYVHADGTREVTAPGSARDRELAARPQPVAAPDENDPETDPED